MTMTRRQIREEIFKIIFQADFHNEDEMKEQVNLFLQDEKMQEAEEIEEKKQEMQTEDSAEKTQEKKMAAKPEKTVLEVPVWVGFPTLDACIHACHHLQEQKGLSSAAYKYHDTYYLRIKFSEDAFGCVRVWNRDFDGRSWWSSHRRTWNCFMQGTCG